MEPNYKIRPASLPDQETIYHFICHLEETAFDREKFAERFKQNISRADNMYLVAVNEMDEPLGFISCQGISVLHGETKVFELQEIYVAKNHRGGGIGKTLMLALEEKLLKLHASTVEVSAHVKRTEARRFYAKFGFAATHIKLVKPL